MFLFSDLLFELPFDLVFFMCCILVLVLYGILVENTNIVVISGGDSCGSSTVAEALVRRLMILLSGWCLILLIGLVSVDAICHSAVGFSCFICGFNSCKIILIGIYLLCLLALYEFVAVARYLSFETVILLNLAFWGILLLVSSYDFIIIYLAIEVQSLSFYVLASLKKTTLFSTEAGLKYFINGSVASAFLLLGIAQIYGATGIINFEELLFFFLNGFMSYSVGFGVIFILCSLLFKLAAAPFHMWSPDVYEGAPAIITMFFSVGPKLGLFVLFVRIFLVVFYEYAWLVQPIILMSGLMSIIISIFGAIKQVRVKRFLAYSSIGHVGYILLGVSGGASLDIVGSVILYVLTYIIMMLCIWFIVIMFYKNYKQGLLYLSDLTAGLKSNFVLAVTFGCVLFSMAGVPPFMGFFAKMFVFLSVINSSFYFVACVGIILSVIGAFYYIRVIKIMFFEKSTNWLVVHAFSRRFAIILGVGCVILCGFIVYPSYALLLSYKIAAFICL